MALHSVTDLTALDYRLDPFWTVDGAPQVYAHGNLVMYGPKRVKVCLTGRGARRHARRIVREWTAAINDRRHAK